MAGAPPATLFQKITRSKPPPSFQYGTKKGNVSPRDVPNDSRTNLPTVNLPKEYETRLPGLADCVMHHFEPVLKISSKGKAQQRLFVLTDEYFYCCTPDGAVKRCHSVGDVTRVLYDNESMGIEMNGFDFLFKPAGESGSLQELAEKIQKVQQRVKGLEGGAEPPPIPIEQADTSAPLAKQLKLKKPANWKVRYAPPTRLDELKEINEKFEAEKKRAEEEAKRRQEEEERRRKEEEEEAERRRKEELLRSQTFAERMEGLIQEEVAKREELDSDENSARAALDNMSNQARTKLEAILEEQRAAAAERAQREAKQKALVSQLMEALDRSKRHEQEIDLMSSRESETLTEMVKRLQATNEALRKSQEEVEKVQEAKRIEVKEVLEKLKADDTDTAERERQEFRRQENRRREQNDNLREMEHRQQQQIQIDTIQTNLNVALQKLRSAQKELLDIKEQTQIRERKLKELSEAEQVQRLRDEEEALKVRQELEQAEIEERKEELAREELAREEAERLTSEHEKTREDLAEKLRLAVQRIEQTEDELLAIQEENRGFEDEIARRSAALLRAKQREAEQAEMAIEELRLAKERIHWETMMQDKEKAEHDRQFMFHSGWLWRSSGIFASWQRRWVTIDGEWVWHVTENNDKPVGLFKTCEISKVQREEKYDPAHMQPPPVGDFTRSLGFSVITITNQKFHFCAETKQSLHAWLTALTAWQAWHNNPACRTRLAVTTPLGSSPRGPGLSEINSEAPDSPVPTIPRLVLTSMTSTSPVHAQCKYVTNSPLARRALGAPLLGGEANDTPRSVSASLSSLPTSPGRNDFALSPAERDGSGLSTYAPPPATNCPALHRPMPSLGWVSSPTAAAAFGSTVTRPLVSPRRAVHLMDPPAKPVGTILTVSPRAFSTESDSD
eukprot:TRINITY_DN31039_c0_g1_i1.p1 TRINITY_DN31039_c0_g1~~TRINITY_DN31039_c0_g1_i1.p1  ORF type:complete len:913 (+),score=178.97 TRINITY_DN31039_c0_g1_i1:27-2741(+)